MSKTLLISVSVVCFAAVFWTATSLKCYKCNENENGTDICVNKTGWEEDCNVTFQNQVSVCLRTVEHFKTGADSHVFAGCQTAASAAATTNVTNACQEVTINNFPSTVNRTAVSRYTVCSCDYADFCNGAGDVKGVVGVILAGFAMAALAKLQ